MTIKCTIQPNGDLEVTADNATRAELADAMASDRGFWSNLSDLFEPYLANGEYAPFDAGEGNPFVGLTSAPCVAESLDHLDNGEREIVGRCWWFPQYMTQCPLEQLRNHGRTVFALAA